MLRRQFAGEMGFVIPSVHLKDNMSLNPNQYVIKLKGEEIARGEVLVDHYLAMDPGEGIEEIEGIDTIEPAFGLKAKWIDEKTQETAQMLGYTVIDPLSVVVTHLSELIKKHANELLGRKEVNQLLDHLRKVNKQMVDDIIPDIITVAICRRCWETFLWSRYRQGFEHDNRDDRRVWVSVKDTDLLTEYVRQALKRTITRKYVENGSIKVITVNPELENTINKQHQEKRAWRIYNHGAGNDAEDCCRACEGCGQHQDMV
jgi:flagellar biosynthesis protein FlhA